MKPCEHLSPYLDGRLERAGRDYFESHLHICSNCRDVVNAWMCAKNGLRNEANVRRKTLTPTDEEAAKLVEWAILEQSSRGVGSIKIWVPITAALSFVVAFWLGSAWMAPSDTESSLPSNPVEMSSQISRTEPLAVPQAPVGVTYETTEDGHTTFKLGRDRFGLAPTSKLSVVAIKDKETVLDLESGAAVFQVSPRKGGRRFIVRAGNYRVLVVGTRFSVNRVDNGVRVSVLEGVVQVSEKGGRGWRLKAGDALSVVDGKDKVLKPNSAVEAETMARLLGELPLSKEQPKTQIADETAVSMSFEVDEAAHPKRRHIQKRKWQTWRKRKAVRKQVVPPIYLEESDNEPDAVENKEADVQALPIEQQEPEEAGVDLWRQWILDGKLQDAEAALVAHLEENPVDTDAYSLLADCRRKAGKYYGAIETYKKLTAIAGEHQANRARFKAGVLMQENLKNHLGAAAIFDEYLATGKGTPLLRAKATVRLAQSLIVLGELERAKMLLHRIIEGYGGSSVAIQARDMLDKLD